MNACEFQHGQARFVSPRALKAVLYDWVYHMQQAGPCKVQGPDLTMKAKMSLMLSTMIPGSVGVPTMVYVFPDPVAPYAKTVVFSPSNTPAIRPCTEWTSSV